MIQKLYDFRPTEIPAALLQAEVTGEEMAAELLTLAARFTVISDVAGPIQNGDVVMLEQPTAQGLRRVYANVGKGFDDVEEALPGLRVGDLAGEARIVAIRRPVVPALTDDHAQKLELEGVSNLRELDDHVFAKLAQGQRRRKFRGIQGIVVKAMLENTEFAPLEENHLWYQALHAELMGRIQAFADAQGATLEQALPAALRLQGKSLEECYAAVKAMCTERARTGALGQALAAENGVSLDGADISDLIEQAADYLNEALYQYYAPKIQVARL